MKKSTLPLAFFLLLMAINPLQAQHDDLLAGAVATGPEILADGGARAGTRTPNKLAVGSEGTIAPAFANLDAYIAGHLAYPEAARENGLEGQVRLRLVIGPDGRVEDAQVVDGLGLGCDEAALHLALNMPAWTPALQSGIPVRSRAIVALNFRIR
jgi:protein TonB